MSIAITPRRASVGLGAVAVGLMLAAATAEGVYAFSTANHAAAVTINGWSIPTDAALKTALSVLCGFALVLAPAIISHKWRLDGAKHHRAGWALAGATALAFSVNTANFAGYFAHNRFQADEAKFRQSAEFKTAQTDLVGSDYFTKRDAREWIETNKPREGVGIGDVLRAALVHLLVMIFAGAGYVADPQPRANTGRRGRRNGRKKEPRAKPQLAVVNN